ncbi:MAG: alpha amylase C-terminal domain-containing protein, partial [Desulfamplus sp.]|nr:alpha amylase C-terminal domain-containing protein [Desulfamplus sp.]
DIVHSHAVSNEIEGLSRFDGTLTQFFHKGERGIHKLWGSRCFDYSKFMVIKFLLSNCRYWLEEYGVDGFRFDGITSMLFKDHAIARAFVSYQDYFEDDDGGANNRAVDLDALSYLYLANRLIHQILPDAITIAEDVSGYPGLAAKNIEEILAVGFDYRFSMGIADFWIKLLKDYKDEEWSLGTLWHELNSRRDDEKTISYAECHDQSLVGDKTIMMHLMGKEIYSSMSIEHETITTFRGVALHKMVRLITIATAADGYLNFMGNEFGHPEWIDFPSKQNNFSFDFAKRQWSLRDNKNLYFYHLAEFDKDMVKLAKKYIFIGSPKPELLHIHEDNRVIAFKREIIYEERLSYLIFIFNFNPSISFKDYLIDAPKGKYQEVMNSDQIKYGGKDRLVANQEHFTNNKGCLSLYLPTRSALVMVFK